MADSKNSNVTTRSMKVTIGEKKSQVPPKKRNDEEKEPVKPHPPIKNKSEGKVALRKPIVPPPIGKRKDTAGR